MVVCTCCLLLGDINSPCVDTKSILDNYILQKATSYFSDSSKFRCYLVMDPSRSASVRSALRYWGCAIQAGTQITGALGFAPQSSMVVEVADKFSPLSFALVPYLSTDSSVDWDGTLDSLVKKTKDLLGATTESLQSSVRFDPSQKSVTLFMPGFDKSEIKLYQVRSWLPFNFVYT